MSKLEAFLAKTAEIKSQLQETLRPLNEEREMLDSSCASAEEEIAEIKKRFAAELAASLFPVQVRIAELRTQMEDQIKKVREAKKLSCTEIQKAFTDLQIDEATLAIEDIFVPSMADVIEVFSRGERVVLIRPKKTPCCAIMIFPDQSYGTRWQLFFEAGSIYKKFPVTCFCCEEHLMADEERREELRDGFREERENEFYRELSSLCAKHGINTVFVRKSGYGKDCVGVRFVEADEWTGVVNKMYGTDIAAQSLSDFCCLVEG